MVTAATRRDARERAIELLYEAESKGIDTADVVAELPLEPDAYALELALGVTDHLIELDHLLGRHARDWPVERMAVMDRIVMRLGSFELATKPEIPTGAALSEAVDLAAQYGSSDDTSKFVNGVLVAVAAEVRDGDRPWMPIDTVVFDLDGVIRFWREDATEAAAVKLGLEPETLAAAAFSEPLLTQAMTGAITAEAWARSAAEKAAEGTGVAVAEAAAVWLDSTWDVDDTVATVARGLRTEGVRTALFSNATNLLEEQVEQMGISDAFDVVANSWRLGVAKPAPEAYESVQEMVGLDPASTLFVDDRDANVLGAVQAGWHAVLMRGPERLGGVLRRLAVDGAPKGP